MNLGRPLELGRRNAYTLTESILTITLIGIIGVSAVPRFLDASSSDLYFFQNEMINALRYAKKVAVASRCTVQVDFAGSDFDLMQQSSCDSGAFSQDLVDPSSGSFGYNGSAPAGVSISSTLDPLYFDALGRIVDSTGAATDVTITIGSLAITGTGESGLVRGS